MGHRTAWAPLALCAIALMYAWASPGLAADPGEPGRLPDHGEYEFRHSLEGKYEGVELAKGVAAAKLQFTVRIEDASESAFLRDATGSCLGVSLYDEQSPTSAGICVFSDADGDMLYMQFTEDPFTEHGRARAVHIEGKPQGKLEEDQVAAGTKDRPGTFQEKDLQHPA